MARENDGSLHFRKFPKASAARYYYRSRPKNGKGLSAGTPPNGQNRETLEFLRVTMAGPRCSGGAGASRPVGTRPELAASGDNLAWLPSAIRLEWGHLGSQLKFASPCRGAGRVRAPASRRSKSHRLGRRSRSHDCSKFFFPTRRHAEFFFPSPPRASQTWSYSAEPCLQVRAASRGASDPGTWTATQLRIWMTQSILNRMITS